MTLTTDPITDQTIPETAVPTIDPAKVEAFAGQLLDDYAGAMTTLMTIVGDRLGLYTALAGAGPVTSDELAATTGLNPRLVREWLAAQTASAYVTYDPAPATYELPAEHALALTEVDSPAYIVGVCEIILGQFLAIDQLERAFRTDGGIPYGAYHGCTHRGIERFFRTAYANELAARWFPSVDGLVERLERGARVADVGCGHGQSTLIMAETWPESTFTGFDFHEPSVIEARANAAEAGASANVSFRVADAADIGPGPFDVVVYFDALHDMGDPPAALRRAYDVLVPGGIVIAVEPWSLDRLEDGIGNPLVRLDYAASTALCTPTSLSQPGAFGLGNQGGAEVRLQLLSQAGFRNPVLAADTGFNLVVAATK